MLTCRGSATIIKFRKYSNSDPQYIKLTLQDGINNYDAYIKGKLVEKVDKKVLEGSSIIYNGKVLFKDKTKTIIIQSIIVVDTFYK